jgi:hypothetical protein
VALAVAVSGAWGLVAVIGTVGTPPHCGVSQAVSATNGNDNNSKNKHRFIMDMSALQ